MISKSLHLLVIVSLLSQPTAALQSSAKNHQQPLQQESSRRNFLASTVAAAVIASSAALSTAPANALELSAFQTAPSGLQWADARVGSGNPLKVGSTATMDYVLSTTGARYGTKIFGTADKDMPYRWTLGDGSTIAGVEQAILGDAKNNVPPLLPGGIRRVVIPQSLGYTALAERPSDLCVQDGRPGPIPPPQKGAFEEYQRFKNIYCNPSRQYQPDIVMDIKLYGARTR